MERPSKEVRSVPLLLLGYGVWNGWNDGAGAGGVTKIPNLTRHAWRQDPKLAREDSVWRTEADRVFPGVAMLTLRQLDEIDASLEARTGTRP